MGWSGNPVHKVKDLAIRYVAHTLMAGAMNPPPYMDGRSKSMAVTLNLGNTTSHYPPNHNS